MPFRPKLFLWIALAVATRSLSALTLSPELPVADRVLGPARAGFATVASDGHGFLMVWQNGITEEVIAARLTSVGMAL